MTEEEWLACEDPAQMLQYLWNRPSDRKLRLFACACARRTKPHTVVDVAEAFADRQIGQEEVWQARSQVGAIMGGSSEAAALHAAVGTIADYPFAAARGAAEQAALYRSLLSQEADPSDSASRDAAQQAHRAEQATQSRLFRDIMGNPFRGVSIKSAWQTATVTSMAQAIYDDRAFDRMPILADALEDAGCTSADILDHCRQGGEHVRGCWVVDLVLGRE
ncbi:hypothetical protein AYO44_17530 [Planctomycetaceae bacterium SCGC AG-212-F19]|nr:hypothetical protein AYO44_17530 [Planctomycetaceae bacterium SCGC AG-212-F19]